MVIVGFILGLFSSLTMRIALAALILWSVTPG
jgi:hypothetical protein